MDEGGVKPDRSNEIDLQPLLDVMIDELNEHCEKLEQHLEAKIEAFMDSGFAIRSASASRQLNEVFDSLVENKRRKSYGWIDFHTEDTEGLIDDQNYLVRYQNMDGTWMCPHLAYWDAEEKQFSLLHSTTFMPPIVHQYLKIPE